MKIHKVQSGGVLLVAMVIILMLSIMGISMMRSATLEFRLSINDIRNTATFQGAESASEVALGDPTHLNDAYHAGLNKSHLVSATPVNASIGLDSVTSVSYVGETSVPGFSIGVGNNFEALLYVLNGISSIDESGTRSSVEQGAFRVVVAD